MCLQCRDVSAAFAPASANLEIAEWKVATLRLPAAAVVGGAPDTYGAKPEIVHLFRVPGKRPPEVISLIFAALAALPLAGLVYGLCRSDVNFKVGFSCLRSRSRLSSLGGL